MAILITGVAGFIGSNLASTLLNMGHKVYGIDNLSRGNLSNISTVLINKNFIFEEVDIVDFASFFYKISNISNCDEITEVWHLAANSDIEAGIHDSSLDLNDTFMTTFNILKVMKILNIKNLFFASSSAIYGDHKDVILSENIGPLLPISNYGAMKLASEAAISAALESFLTTAYIFRFPNVVGVPATHGIILDFVRKLIKDPQNLIVLGDGMQQKGYLHVSDLINAMLYIKQESLDKLSVFNIGPLDSGVSVRFIAEEVCRLLSPEANVSYTGGAKGWIGDIPKFIYSIDKIRSLGWEPSLSSKKSIEVAINEIIRQEF